MTLIEGAVGIDSGYKHSELTETIIGVFYDVYNELGFGFLESVYRNALRLALIEKGLHVEPEVPVSVFFRGVSVGDFRADLVVNKLILLELKTAEKIVRAHEAQTLNYLRSTALELGLILSFGPQPQVSQTAARQLTKACKVSHAWRLPLTSKDQCHQR